VGISFQAGASQAPDTDLVDGLYPAKFAGVAVKLAVTSKFGTSDKYIWAFDLYEDNTFETPIYDPKGEEVTIDIMTSQSLNVESETVPAGVKILKALLTPLEFEAFKNGEAPNSDDLIGRPGQLQLEINAEGWPRGKAFIPLAVSRARKPAAE
jgi:hypothetical protein